MNGSLCSKIVGMCKPALQGTRTGQSMTRMEHKHVTTMGSLCIHEVGVMRMSGLKQGEILAYGVL